MQPKPRTTVRVVSLTLRLGEKFGEEVALRFRCKEALRRPRGLVPQPVRGHVGLTDALRVLEHRVYRVESQVIR